MYTSSPHHSFFKEKIEDQNQMINDTKSFISECNSACELGDLEKMIAQRDLLMKKIQVKDN